MLPRGFNLLVDSEAGYLPLYCCKASHPSLRNCRKWSCYLNGPTKEQKIVICRLDSTSFRSIGPVLTKFSPEIEGSMFATWFGFHLPNPNDSAFLLYGVLYGHWNFPAKQCFPAFGFEFRGFKCKSSGTAKFDDQGKDRWQIYIYQIVCSYCELVLYPWFSSVAQSWPCSLHVLWKNWYCWSRSTSREHFLKLIYQ